VIETIEIRPGDLWVHLAASRELKTTVLVNRVYYSLLGGGRVAYVGDYQPHIEARLLALHSLNLRHSYERLAYPFQNTERDRGSLNDLRLDFEELSNLLFIPTISDAEKLGPFSLIAFDDLTSENQGSNDFIDLRRVTRGQNVAAIASMTVPLTSRRRAAERDGYYQGRNVEPRVYQDADVVTATFLDPELERAGRAHWTTLKYRDGPAPLEIPVQVDFGGTLKVNQVGEKPSKLKVEGAPWWERL